MKKLCIILLSALSLTAMAQSSFDKFKQQQNSKFGQFKETKQAEFDAFRKRINEQYAEFMRKQWDAFPAHEADKPIDEKTAPPVVYTEPEPQPAPQPKPQPTPQPKPQPTPQPKPQEDKRSPKEDVKPLPAPKPGIDTKPVQIAVKPKVQVVPKPQPAPEPIAPVLPKEDPFKKVTVNYYGTLVTIGFPLNDNLKLRALKEEAIVEAWQQLSDSKYDITVKTALDARKAYILCDWAYMKMLQAATEKQYGKTNEAVLAQAFVMVQTAFEYGYDDKIWGADRAFFAQETLYYPYCDCEDRAILFSRLVRDLVGLDVVLLYYPGHLATAVAFNEEVNGDWLSFRNRKYVVCDPTYINAGVGRTMPNMNNQQAQIIAL